MCNYGCKYTTKMYHSECHLAIQSIQAFHIHYETVGLIASHYIGHLFLPSCPQIHLAVVYLLD